MSISFACGHCGKAFKTDEGLAGKKVKCKQCGNVFLVPSVSAAYKPPAPAPSARPMAKPARTDSVDPYADLDDDPYAIEEPVAKAKPFSYDEEDDLPPPPRATWPQTSDSSRSRRGREADRYQLFEALPGKVFLGAFGLLAILGLLSTVVPKVGGPLLIGGIVLTVVPLYLYAAAGFLILPFKEGALHGLACLFVPFYSLYYLLTRWDYMKGPFINSLASLGMVIVMAVFLPFIASKRETPFGGGAVTVEAFEAPDNPAGAIEGAGPGAEFPNPEFPVPVPPPGVPFPPPRPGFGPQMPIGPPPGFGPPGRVPFPVPPVFRGAGAVPPGSPLQPDESITLEVSGLADDETQAVFAEKLNAMLRAHYQGAHTRGVGGGGRMTYKIGPITDNPMSFADLVDWANVKRIDGRTLAVEMATLPNARQKPAGDDFVAGVLFDLESPARQKRKDALRRLLGAPPDEGKRVEVARAVEPMLRDPDRFTRADAAKALAVWGGPENTPGLVKSLRDPAFDVRWAVLDAFAVLQDPAGAEGVAKWLSKDRDRASEALKAMGPGAEPAVIPYLGIADVFTRMEAAKILQVIGTESSIGPLRELVRRANGHGLDAMAANEALLSLDRAQGKTQKTPRRR